MIVRLEIQVLKPNLKSQNKGITPEQRTGYGVSQSTKKLCMTKKSARSEMLGDKHSTRIRGCSDNAEYSLSVLTAILADCLKNLPLYSITDYTRDVATLQRRISLEGFRFVTKVLPNLADGLLCQLETGTSHYPGFKTRMNVPCFMRGIFVAVFKSNIAERDKALYIKAIYQIGVSFKKFEGVIPEGADSILWDQFVSTDRELKAVPAKVHSEFETSQTIKLVRHYFRAFFEGLKPKEHKEFLPKPGPGATAAPVPKFMRYQPQHKYLSLEGIFKTWDWFYTCPIDAMMDAGHIQSLKVSARPFAKYLVVPKTAEKGRGICSEMNEAQYLQQAFSRMVRCMIREHPELSEYLKLNDQTVNGALAIRASLTKKDCTIDFSEASDRVIRELISYVTQDNVDVHDILMALATVRVKKSEEIQHDVRAIELNKFAPMGSALCFPIMSLFNYFLCKAVIKRTGVTNSKAKRVYVYGDDIITDTRYYKCLANQLPKFGLKLNVMKSYANSYFRESCGKHAYYGINITPVYIRNRPENYSPKIHSSVLMNEHLFFTKGFKQTAEFLRHCLRGSGLKATYEVPTNSGIFGYRRNRQSLREDWREVLCSSRSTRITIDDDLQCISYRLQTAKEENTGSYNMKPCAALTRWHCTRTEDSRNVVDALPYKEKTIVYSWKWVPESRLYC